MSHVSKFLRFVVGEFGSLIVFLLLNAALGLKIAIAGTILWVLVDGARHLWRKIPFTRIYLLSSGLAICFGIVDLLSKSPFMLQYEAVITNCATGFAFVAGAFGEKPMIQEIAEQRASAPFPARLDVHRFFQLFTLFWAAYFFLKAGFYLYTAIELPMARALILRPVVGGVSLLVMLGISMQGRKLFDICRALHLLPYVPPEAAAETAPGPTA
jgi:intracellular septation protein A